MSAYNKERNFPTDGHPHAAKGLILPDRPVHNTPTIGCNVITGIMGEAKTLDPISGAKEKENLWIDGRMQRS